MMRFLSMIFYEFFFFYILHFLCVLVPMIILIAFITLLESKELASMQKSSGPNVLGFFGLLQPFADGMKLLLKEPVFPYTSNKLIFFISPILTFSLSVAGWAVIPLGGVESFLSFDFSILYLLALSSLSVYGIILSGWSSNSKYAFLGALRSSAQMISYEVSFSLFILPLMVVSHSMNLGCIVSLQSNIWFCFPFFISAICVFISILAETNRSPFDLPEAEAELVSGYNVEYSAMFFALFYLAEYLSILLMSTIFVLLFLGGWFFFGFCSFIVFSIKVMFVVYCVVWVRVTFPRYRFDQLMQIGWKVLLPLAMGIFMYIGSIFFFFSRFILLFL